MSCNCSLSRASTRCQRYIGDTFGYHAKDLDVICFGKSPVNLCNTNTDSKAACFPAVTLEDLVPAEDEAPIEAYITEVASVPPPPPSFLPSLIRTPCTRATMAQMRAAAPSTTSIRDPPLLPIPLPAPSTSHKPDMPEADTAHLGKRLLRLLSQTWGVRLGRVLLLLRDSQDPLWLVGSIAVL
ncbi:hypothetical protein Tco_0159216 [Tanacetum coccineum]